MKYDVVIIGGGITGTGIAHELAKYQLKIDFVRERYRRSFLLQQNKMVE
mgnify:CR=1 FL=1